MLGDQTTCLRYLISCLINICVSWGRVIANPGVWIRNIFMQVFDGVFQFQGQRQCVDAQPVSLKSFVCAVLHGFFFLVFFFFLGGG